MKPEDDYTHPLSDEPNFNESMYFQFHDADAGIGGFLRIANRANEGRGERTVCLYLPDGRVAFGFERPVVTTNDRFDAAGLAINVIRPFEQIDVAFTGPVTLLDDPHDLSDPKRALTSSPAQTCIAVLSFTPVGPAFAESFDGAGESFAPNHYEQSMAASGTITIGDETFPVVGHGLRDHSWGPRSWQAPWFYRWAHGTSERLSFMGAYFGNPDGSSLYGGFVVEDGELFRCETVDIATKREENGYQTQSTVELRSGDRAWRLVGTVVSNVPLRHRKRDGDAWAVTRIVEGATRWTTDDGTEIHGMTEYLDQMTDAGPVGIAV